MKLTDKQLEELYDRARSLHARLGNLNPTHKELEIIVREYTMIVDLYQLCAEKN